MMRQRSLATAVLFALASFSCGSRPEEEPPRFAPSAPRPQALTEPRVLEQVDPEFSEATSRFLADPSAKLTVVFHIAVRQDGTMRSVQVVRAEPADLPVARTFAEEVALSMPKWRFRPAMLDGKPVDAEFDFTLEAQGGLEGE